MPMQNHCIALNIIPNLKFLLRYVVFLHTSVLFYIEDNRNFRIYIIATKQYYNEKQTSKKQSNTVKQKAMIESLIFQTNWGIKKLYKNPSDLISTLVKVELEYIIELNLFEDLLLLKMFIENVKSVFGVEPIAEYGDFNRSLVALALGIGKVNDIEKAGIPIAWHELLEKKILSIYYTNDIRNTIVDYAKHNGYNVSTYLGKPVIKLSKIFVLLERAR